MALAVGWGSGEVARELGDEGRSVIDDTKPAVVGEKPLALGSDGRGPNLWLRRVDPVTSVMMSLGWYQRQHSGRR